MHSFKQDSIRKRCLREIRELHQFFEGWLSGTLPEEGAFERLEQALAPGFRLIHPSGEWRARKEIISGLRKQHGSQPELTIEIRNAKLLRGGENRVLAAYEEWQRGQNSTDGRLSTVVFHRAEDNLPNGLRWEHVHETWKQAPTEMDSA